MCGLIMEMTPNTSKIAIITDQSPYSGIGTYAHSLYSLLKDTFPNLKLILTPYSSASLSDGAIVPPLNKTTSTLMAYPLYRFLNSWRNSKYLSSAADYFHLCGMDYTLAERVKESICTVYDFYYRLPSRSNWSNPKELLATMSINVSNIRSMRSMRKCNALISISEETSAAIKKSSGLDSKVVHLWVQETFHPRPKQLLREKLSLPHNLRILLNVSGGGANKNLNTLRRIIDMLPEYYRLVKIGYPINHPKVINLSRVSSIDYPLYFNACDVYVHTSIREGFGIPLLESLASGIPIVTNKSSTSGEVVGKAGLSVANPFDPSEYNSMILKLENAEIYAEMSRLARERSSLFSRETAWRKMIDIYTESFGL